MQIIPVLDLASGVAVHAQAGDRARYQPVQSVLTPGRTATRSPCCKHSATCSGCASATSLTSTRSRAARSSATCSGSWPSSMPASPVPAWWTPAPAARRRRLEVLPAAPARWCRTGDVPSLRRSRRHRLGRRPRHAWSSASTSDWASPSSHPAMQDASGAGSGCRRSWPPRPLTRACDAAGARPRAGRNGLRSGSRAAGRVRRRFPRVRLLAGGGVAGAGDLTAAARQGATARSWPARSHEASVPRVAPSVQRERLAVGGRLAVVLLHFELQQGQVACSPPRASSSRTRLPRYWASISAVLFGIGSIAQSRLGKT